MIQEDMLARLISQAQGEGAELVTMRAVVEEASSIGVSRVLGRLGLDDHTAQTDLIELRQLLAAWRDAKASARNAAAAWIVRGVLALLLIGIAVRMGAVELLK